MAAASQDDDVEVQVAHGPRDQPSSASHPYLLVPFTVLPAVLWWAIPLGILAVSLYRLRPAAWTWPVLAAVLCYPRAWIVLVYGNPSLWVFATLAAGLVWT